MTPRTLIFCRENAQLGNRLIVYAHLLAAARERGWKLVNPTFEPYADWFVGTQLRPHGRSMTAVRWAWQVGKLIAPFTCGRLARARARGTAEVNLQVTLPSAEAQNARWLLLQGFRIRCPEWTARHAVGLRDFFTPVDAHRLPAEARIAELRARAHVIVGVHVRQGDYAQHLGGRYFYTIDQYARFMTNMRALLVPRTVAFLVCTHVPLPTEPLSGLTWAAGPGSAAADLHALSCCDYLLGPPSSFSAWAAFHGDRPLLHIEDPQAAWSLADFQRPLAPDILH